MNVKKNLKYIIIALIILVSAFSYLNSRSKRIEAVKSGPHVMINRTLIGVELADTPAKQYQGLSNRAGLDKDKGMLFVFQNRRQRSFVMRDMNFALDIIWIDGDKIVKIDENLPPEGANPAKSYSSMYEVSHVLEVNAGFVRKKKIKVGDEASISL